MRFHKEGTVSIVIATLLLAASLTAAVLTEHLLWHLVSLGLLILWILILQFFRNPDRSVKSTDENIVLSPADGQVVTIEEVDDHETQVGKRIQISIFMSPLNVHVNRVPISGTIKYFRYHAGKYLVAWHPKSSTENERTTFVLSSTHGDIVIRQIAGAVARRIVSYPPEGAEVVQGQELGFIKFGSRCDILLPIHAEIKVAIGDKVKGNIHTLATFNS